MLADDVIAERLHEILEDRMECMVVRAADVADAVRDVRETTPFMVVGVDGAGRTLCRAIRALDDGDRIPVYVLATSAEELRLAAETGADGCMRVAAGAPGLELLLGSDVVRRLRASATSGSSRVVSRVCHEMRTSLAGVVGYLDLLADDEDEVRLAELSEHARRNARRLAGLVNDLLDLTAFESGDLTLIVGTVDFVRVVQDAIAHVRPEAERRGLMLRLDVAPDLPELVTADESALRRVFDHLLDNAVKFTTSGRVGVSLRSETVRAGEIVVHVEVSDTGIGIEPSHRARVFDAFWQADPSFTRATGGMGVGLTIARRLVAMMGGTVALTSTMGEGSVFRVTIPLRRAASP